MQLLFMSKKKKVYCLVYKYYKYESVHGKV